MKKGDILHGFKIVRIREMKDMGGIAIEAVHMKSGAKLLHLSNNDEEKLFSAIFKTPAIDNTGRTHILEHMALGGSKRFAVKDPFFAMFYKNSMNTFMNAFTGRDVTFYPFTTTNKRDFFNLAEVYLDLVFFPTLSKESFMQEAWHHALKDPKNINSDLVMGGIVFNEMKGAMSDRGRLILQKSTEFLFPNNTYGFNSGGDPKYIPTLTHKELIASHRQYYHPANCQFLFYGDVPTEELFEFLDKEYLSKFKRIKINISIAEQPRWEEPKYVEAPFPISESEPLEGQTVVTMHFLTNPTSDVLTTLAMDLIADYLLGSDAAPLKKVLLESGLGTGLTQFFGYGKDQRDTVFFVGLNGTEKEHKDKIVDLIVSTCMKIARKGFEKEKIDLALHQLEVEYKTIEGEGYPYPVSLLFRIRSWVHGVDPVFALEINKHIDKLKHSIKEKEGFLENILTKMIINNPHHVVGCWFPDKDLADCDDGDFQKIMQETKAGMTKKDLFKINETAEMLKKKAGEPDSPEALATLPRLPLGDIPTKPLYLKTTEDSGVAGATLLHTEMLSNGMNYIDVAFPIPEIIEDDQLTLLLPFFVEAVCGMGANDQSYEVLAHRELSATGGISGRIHAAGTVEDTFCTKSFLVFSSSALDRNFKAMLEVFTDRVLKADFDDKGRLKNILKQEINWQENSFIESANSFAARFAAQHFSRNTRIKEMVGGITQLRFLKKIALDFDSLYPVLLKQFEIFRSCFLSEKNGLLASFVGSGDNLVIFRDYLNNLNNHKTKKDIYFASLFPNLGVIQKCGKSTGVGIATATQANYNACSMPVFELNEKKTAALFVLSHMLSGDFMFPNIRLKGNAYGARAMFDSLNKVFGLTSYRDPHIIATYKVFDRAFDYVKNEMDLSVDTLERFLVSALGSANMPVRPANASWAALFRHLTGQTQEYRDRFWLNCLSVTEGDIGELMPLLEKAYKKACVCTVSGEDRLKEVKKEFNSELGIDLEIISLT
ncbi:insulinase family protein [Patescibacteria group bacterium]|nr:insulinase family protein [Patescibacteria group bacterium]